MMGCCWPLWGVVLLTTASASSSVRGSGGSVGCALPTAAAGEPVNTLLARRLPLNKTVSRKLAVADRNGLVRNRSYAIHLPSNYDYESPRPVPLLLYIHGQSGTAKGSIAPYVAIGEREGFITVSGQGMDDGNCSTGWNVGATGLTETCTREAWSPFGAAATCCYETCQELGKCSSDGEGANCGWSTCFEDLDFFAELLKHIGQEVCVNMGAVFATGASNGGMMVHRLTAEMPTVFRAVVPIYGLPLAGQLKVPQPLATVSILQLHDRWDTTIPLAGGKSGQGWLYESLNATLRAWVDVGAGKVAGAELVNSLQPPVPIKTAWDGGEQRLACIEYAQLSQAGASDDDSGPEAALESEDDVLKTPLRRVIQCLFDGYHGSWLPRNHGEELTWWFFKQFVQQRL
eukprot:COSAG02_NODE_604_length_19688_cov_77.556231_6_plen_402_part_00